MLDCLKERQSGLTRGDLSRVDDFKLVDYLVCSLPAPAVDVVPSRVSYGGQTYLQGMLGKK